MLSPTYGSVSHSQPNSPSFKQATFNENTAVDVKKVAEYERQEHFEDLEVPSDIRGWIQNPNDSFKSSRFLNTANKDILALTSIRFVRPDRSHRWVMTLAYQLMLQRLIVEPLRYVTAKGLLQSDTIMLVLLDCIDCSKNAPTVASDIAYLVKELEGLNEQPLKLLITGLPDHTVLSKFYKVPIQTSELQRPTQVVQQSQHPEAPPAPSLYEAWNALTILQKVHCILSPMALEIIAVRSTVLVGIGAVHALDVYKTLGCSWSRGDGEEGSPVGIDSYPSDYLTSYWLETVIRLV
ncbi:hypothetical protein BDQ17DRAFT_1331474 [Cyathus striatus]|nr:hypothetical protein BDQ17DRAFT_1331474 [Cyathus striatus]